MVYVGAMSGIAAADAIWMPKVFGDGMVLQRGGAVPVWGKASPGSKVTVGIAGQSVSAVANDAGLWRVDLAALDAGGPHTLRVEAGSERIEFADVLVGEVWICSGQSNMEWNMASSDSAGEIASVNHPQIRLLNGPRVRSKTPMEDIDVKWEVCGPDAVRVFSAVAYHFGERLHRELNVPVGLIKVAWGGTAAEAWTPIERLRELSIVKDRIDPPTQEQLEATWKSWVPKLKAWHEASGRGDPGMSMEAAEFARADFDDSSWQVMKMPGNIESQGAELDGIFWLRATVELSEAQIANVTSMGQATAMLSLGAIDDMDRTFVNGVEVGSTGPEIPRFWMTPRQYAVPAEVLKPGKNVIAVRVHDHMGNGGISGPIGSMWIGPADVESNEAKTHRVGLPSEWRFGVEHRVTPKSDAPIPPAPSIRDRMAGELWNGMVHPLVPYALRGAIWYQGESNADEWREYADLMQALIESWREAWGGARGGSEFPFLQVQLAGFMNNTGEPGENPNWANLREAQRRVAARMKNVGMAVAIDVGDAKDIHPRNKRAVGDRLAQIALADTYGKSIVPGGPRPVVARRDGAGVRVSFDRVGSGLIARDNDLSKNFALRDAEGNWAWADATIEGETIKLSAGGIGAPTRVRYAWQNLPPASLYNAEKLPAEPFEIEVVP
jgi:sialate O-acetylesterase